MRYKIPKGMVLMAVMLAAGGCAVTAEDESWAPWYEFRGYCRLELTVHVKSLPEEAEVYLGNDFIGITPCEVLIESAPCITGEKCKVSSPIDGRKKVLVRNTQFEDRNVYTLWVLKKGLTPMSKTIVLENFFPSVSLDHESQYKKSITMTFSWKQDHPRAR